MDMISRDLLIHDLCPSGVAGLGALQLRMFKKWTGYAKSGHPITFYRSTEHHGWHMKEMVPFYKRLQLIKCHLLKHSSDPEVRLIYEARAKFEHQCFLSNDPVKRGQWRPTQALEAPIDAAKHASKIPPKCPLQK